MITYKNQMTQISAYFSHLQMKLFTMRITDNQNQI